MEKLSGNYYVGFAKKKLWALKVNKNFCIAIFLCQVWTTAVFAQSNNSITPSPVMPMSPNAGSLAIFTDYPVSHYTGIPNITVPLHEINVDGFKLPVALAYHASGIQVSQEASWVGLGWALNAGGAISRSIKGGDDFREYLDAYTLAGYYMDQDFDNVQGNSRYYDGGTWGQGKLVYDTEPDIFYYSFPGGSGKFVIDKSRGPVLMDKNSNVKIEIVNDTSIDNFWNKNLCFRITTPDGTQYYYKRRENTKSYSNGQALNQNSTDPNRILDGGLGPNSPFEYTSSWQLDKITTVNKRVISFQYALETYESPTQESATKSTTIMTIGGGACAPPNGFVSYQTSKTRHEALRLVSITWDMGHIDFSASAREDMRGWDTSLPPKKLDMLQVFDYNNTLVRQVNFNYTYFNGDKTGLYDYVFKRLKLENVVFDNDLKNRYIFRYIPGELLAKNSNNKDYWGHHNGKVYGADYYVGASIGTTMYFGANKSADINFMKAGTLDQIVYPTGGSTTFLYEANTFPKGAFNSTTPVSQPSLEKVLGVYNDYSNRGDYESPPTSTYQFTRTVPFRISILKFIDNTVCPSFDPTFSYAHPLYPIGRLKRISPDEQTIRSFPIPQINGESSYCQFVEDWPHIPLTSSDFYADVLPAGTYEFEALTPPRDVYIRWRINFLLQGSESTADPMVPVAGGGLRIAKIISGSQTKSYTYPAGKLIISPVLGYMKTFYCADNPNLNQQTTLQQLSVSSVPLSTMRGGNSIGYDWVDETIGLGKVRHNFYNEMEENLAEAPNYGYTYFPYAGTSIDYYNGMPQKIEYFRNNALLKSIEYNYSSRYSNTVYGYIYNSNDSFGMIYGYRFQWLLKASEVTNTYFPGSSTPVEEVSMFSYNDDFQLSSIKRRVSGIWEEQKIKYARDFTGPVYQAMVDRHQIGVPIESVKFKNNLVVGADRTDYFETMGLIVPKEVYSLNISAPVAEASYSSLYKKKAQFDLYNTNGKVLQMNERGRLTTYLWGYQNYFPIAKVSGASFSQASGVVGAPTISALEQMPGDATVESAAELLRNSLAGSQVQSYTYRPLVGVTGITNERGRRTSFTYFPNSRLEHVKDHLGNIIRSYAYNYRGNSFPYTVADNGIPIRNEGLAHLEDTDGNLFPGRFRVSLYNNFTGVTYVYDFDASTKRIGGFPPGRYDIKVVNLDNIPIGNFSVQLNGNEVPGGIQEQAYLDEGYNFFQIF